jgi:hypothetical protein
MNSLMKDDVFVYVQLYTVHYSVVKDDIFVEAGRIWRPKCIYHVSHNYVNFLFLLKTSYTDNKIIFYVIVLSTLFLVALGDDKIIADELFIKKTPQISTSHVI